MPDYAPDVRNPRIDDVPGQRRIMATPDSLQGSLDLLVLKILSRRPGLHGYALMTAIHESSREVLRVEEGSLYPALHRMEEAGWIRAEWIAKDSGRGGGGRATRTER